VALLEHNLSDLDRLGKACRAWERGFFFTFWVFCWWPGGMELD
jgi:hypothetical protein